MNPFSTKHVPYIVRGIVTLVSQTIFDDKNSVFSNLNYNLKVNIYQFDKNQSEWMR